MLQLRSLSLCLAVAGSVYAEPPKAVSELAGLDRAYPSLDALYQDLHRNPELSKHEEKTAAKMAARLRELGFQVTEHVGGTGVVGVLRNGNGPTVLVRTDMDAYVGLVPGPASAAANAVDITFFGRSGHGAAPHRAIDPIVMASSTVMALQTLVSRENNPFDTAVVTVGTFHSGTKRNIIPEEARLELTVRSYKPEVQKRLLAGIERIAKAQALSAGAPREPKIVVLADEASEVVVNDPALIQRLSAPLKRAFGDKVGPSEPTSGSEDFGVYGRVAGVPGVQLRIGASDPVEFAKAKEKGTLPPGPHNDGFAPVREPTIRAGVSALTVSVLELLGKAPTRG